MIAIENTLARIRESTDPSEPMLGAGGSVIFNVNTIYLEPVEGLVATRFFPRLRETHAQNGAVCTPQPGFQLSDSV
jgi:hypothetical protein